MLETKVPQFPGNQLGIERIIFKVEDPDLMILKLTHRTTERILAWFLLP
jgi:hypothetical protein